jgi:outer membrane lipoprotein carrier protein
VEQLIVADGQQVWVYDEDLEQVTVKDQNNQLNPIYVIINDELSNQHYDIAYELSSHGIDWVSMTPKTPSEEVRAVWLALEDKLVKQIKVFNQFDQVMVFEFYQIERNPEMAQDLFSFIPPEGVDVVQAISE